MLNFGLDQGSVCRDDRCELDGIHECHDVPRRQGQYRWDSTSRSFLGNRAEAYTKSKRHRHQPWKANCTSALRDAALRSVSLIEPRNFATLLSYVENDYGSCCPRSLHRHLVQLRSERAIVRLEFRGNVHAYLLAGSRLIADPDLVHEQVTMLYGEVA